MHFKRKGPKSTRAGCLLCKPYKRQGVSTRDKNMQHGDHRRCDAAERQIADYRR